MAENIWIYSCPVAVDALVGFEGVQCKTDWFSARTRLSTLASAQITVAYPMPWQLDAFEQTDAAAWQDFYLDALALNNEFPGRIQFRPVRLAAAAADATDEPLLAFLTEVASPDICSVLEALEMVALLDGRAPWLRGRTLRLSPALAGEMLRVHRLAAQLPHERAKLTEARLEIDRLQEELGEITRQADSALKHQESQLRDEAAQTEQRLLAENGFLLQQLHDAQAQLKDAHLLNQQKAEESAVELQRFRSERDMADTRAEEEHTKATRLQTEVDVLLEQLHDSQASLRSYHDELESLKKEAQLARNTMQWATRLLLARMPRSDA